LDEISFAYFKSTDGHTLQWDFNLRRVNLHLLPLIKTHGGIILVDSTRRGKRHPDALSRTVPIWCAVINRALGLENEHSCLFTPPDSVSPSEHAQMADKIDEWAKLLNVRLANAAFVLFIEHMTRIGFCIQCPAPDEAATAFLD
jgi:hypothetical protein